MRKQIVTLLLIGCSIIVNAQIKNLDKLPIAKRDSILLDLAKQAVLYYGPEFYEINRPPLIERKVISAKYEDAGRVWLIVKYYYKNEFYESTGTDASGNSFLVLVCIWEDTGLVESVVFEPTYGMGFSNLDKPRTKSKNGKRFIIKRYPIRSAEIDDTTKTVKNGNVLNGIDYDSVKKKYIR